MKYLKLYEELDFRRGNSSFRRRRNSDDDIVEYISTVDDVKYEIGFERQFDNFWTRDYENSKHTGFDYSQTNKNALKIVSVVTDVTEDFIEKYNPDAIIMYHVNMRNENASIDKLNKRARINYYYLKDINGYNLVYYNQLSGDRVRTTNCILHKIGVDISSITNKLSSMFWDNCILVKP